MLAKVHSCAMIGLEGILIEVEIDIAQGLPAFTVWLCLPEPFAACCCQARSFTASLARRVFASASSRAISSSIARLPLCCSRFRASCLSRRADISRSKSPACSWASLIPACSASRRRTSSSYVCRAFCSSRLLAFCSSARLLTSAAAWRSDSCRFRAAS